MSSNDDYLIDDYGESSDWIEIYNSSDNSINLGEYYLTDDPDDLTKWGFPNQIITSHSFVLVFASGRDISQSNQTLHTNFKIGLLSEI